MPGVPGRGGPVPKRSSHRHGHRSKADKISGDRAPAVRARPPAANRRWHPVARRWYEALTRSGQREFYEASDWATAYLIAESMSRELRPQVVGTDPEGEPIRVEMPLKGASLSAYLRAMTSLLVTEGDRRRVKLELGQPDAGGEEAGDVSWIDDARRRLRASD